MDRQEYFLRLSLVACNLASLQEVASTCKASGAVEVTVSSDITNSETFFSFQVLVLQKDLALEESCIQAVAETVAQYGGKAANVLQHMMSL